MILTKKRTVLVLLLIAILSFSITVPCFAQEAVYAASDYDFHHDMVGYGPKVHIENNTIAEYFNPDLRLRVIETATLRLWENSIYDPVGGTVEQRQAAWNYALEALLSDYYYTETYICTLWENQQVIIFISTYTQEFTYRIYQGNIHLIDVIVTRYSQDLNGKIMDLPQILW